MSIKVETRALKFVTIKDKGSNKEYLCVCRDDRQEVCILSLKKVLPYNEVEFTKLPTAYEVSQLHGIKEKFSYDSNYIAGLYPYSEVELNMLDVRRIEALRNRNVKKENKSSRR